MAQPEAAVSSLRPVADAVRVRRPAPRRLDQPRGSVELRQALIDLGLGLWLSEPAAKRYGQTLRARGKKGGVIACAMAHRANKIAYALVRDQTRYDPTRWT